MEVLFLGSGTSTGIPQIGCECKVCRSADLKDKRLRASVLITSGDTTVLIDCGPDLRQQLISYQIKHISGILLTHEHYDHIAGLDDVRPLGKINLYAESMVLDVIQRNMPYCFAQNRYPNTPSIALHTIDEQPFVVGNLNIQPIRVMHAQLPILGFRIGSIAYLTDVKTISDTELEKLKGLDTLIINSLRIAEHHSHLSLSESLELAAKIGARQTYFTHMSHDMGLHAEVTNMLPPNIQLAYDGLKLIIHN